MKSNRGRVLGIDFGTKRVGVALSDPMRVLASGRSTIANSAEMIQTITTLVREEEVALIVVGMPYAPDGGSGRKGEEVSRFIQALSSATSVPIETWDESLTSVEALVSMKDAGMKRRKQREKGRVDEMAARLILQGYLDHAEPGAEAQEGVT